MIGTLYSVATPIGHMDDISLRALQVLRSVDLILCEDTRETKKLLKHHGVETAVMPYHAHSQNEAAIIARLKRGEQLALVADRGTPGISDPGAALVQGALAAEIPVVPIPGASAVLCALQAAGVDTHAFAYKGYVPHKKGRQTFLQDVIARKETVVFYESPHRILKCLEQLIQYGIAERNIVLARELTKIHEEFIRGTTESALRELQSREKVLGEFVVVVNAS